MSAASFLHSSFLHEINVVMHWSVHVQEVPQASKHLDFYLDSPQITQLSDLCCVEETRAKPIYSDTFLPFRAVQFNDTFLPFTVVTMQFLLLPGQKKSGATVKIFVTVHNTYQTSRKTTDLLETVCGAVIVVCWLLNVPATCLCISGTDLHRQLYLLSH